MNPFNKLKSLLSDIKTYWRTPPEGRYMTFKEIVSLAVGGIGVRFIVFCVGTMILGVGNSLIGNTIGIPPTEMYIIYIIAVIAGLPLTALRAKMIDNTRSMKGKYRPYILTMGIPTVLLGIGFIWMPYEKMTLTWQCVTVLLFNIGFQFFYSFMNDAYDSLTNVLSPNSIERTDVYAVKSVVENLSPSIANIFIPIAAKAITGDNTLYDMRVYRVIYPPLLFAGFLLSILVYVNTREKIIKPRSRTTGISFIDAFRAVARNKFFWIISLAGWIGFLENSFHKIMEWKYNYQKGCSAGQYSLITAISGNASLWPNIFGPILIRKHGKKKILIISNILNVLFIAAMLPVVRMHGPGSIWILLVFIFINTMLTALGHFMNPSLNADIRDYQQYISGERIDGMFSAVGLIGSIITMITSSVLPIIQEKAGLNEATAVSLGYSAKNVYDVLYNTELFNHICSILIGASVLGAALNVIPFFFYDLTETKQKGMVAVLKIRAYFEDLSNGIDNESSKEEVNKIILDAQALEDEAPRTLSKEESRRLKSENKKAIAEILNRNEEIEIASFILAEINRFHTPSGEMELEDARKIASCTEGDFISALNLDISVPKALPKSTPAEREFRNRMISNVRDNILAKKTMEKYFSDGLPKGEDEAINDLFSQLDIVEAEINDCYNEIKASKENKDKKDLSAVKLRLKKANTRRNEIDKKISALAKKNNIRARALKPYTNAVKTVSIYEFYEQIIAKK